MAKSPLLIQGLHGLGDNIHQRAVLRQLLQTREIWLETSWPSIYHDLAGPDLHLMRRPVGLRTQTKNASREIAKFDGRDPPRCERMRIAYSGADVMDTNSKTVLEAMCRNTFTDYTAADYRLPVPREWFDDLNKIVDMAAVANSGKPLLVYRPLVERPEWRGGTARNANVACYTHLFAFLRSHFYVVSVADLAPGKEWIVGPQLKADVTLHAGELPFEALAALFSSADLAFTSSGFAAILAPAVGTPCINIVGGYEYACTHDSGSRFTPLLSIGPKEPCHCWTSACNRQCRKDIEMGEAVKKIASFAESVFGINVLPRLGDPNDMFEPNMKPAQAPLAHPQHAALLRTQGLKA